MVEIMNLQMRWNSIHLHTCINLLTNDWKTVTFLDGYFFCPQINFLPFKIIQLGVPFSSKTCTRKKTIPWTFLVEFQKYKRAQIIFFVSSCQNFFVQNFLVGSIGFRSVVKPKQLATSVINLNWATAPICCTISKTTNMTTSKTPSHLTANISADSC